MFKQRLITALILLPIVLSGLFLLNPLHFSWFVAFVVIVGAWEWARLAGFESQISRWVYAAGLGLALYLGGVVAPISLLVVSVCWWVAAIVLVLTYPDSSKYWSGKAVRAVLGLVTLIPFWVSMVFIREAELLVFPELNVLWVLLYSMAIVWAADTGAYFAGRAWGNKKLAPKVSPGKSWAGAWGGMASCALFAVMASFVLGASLGESLQLLLITVIAGAISIVGDLTESMFKRNEGIKDSSQLLPGHGGVLDRIDSLTAAVPVFVSLLLLLGWMQ